ARFVCLYAFLAVVSSLSDLSYPAVCFFFFSDPPPTEIYTLSLHDALPISERRERDRAVVAAAASRRVHWPGQGQGQSTRRDAARSEEHTSELQSRENLVCRLLLEKKKKQKKHQDALSH